jgi:hypothetical protein
VGRPAAQVTEEIKILPAPLQGDEPNIAEYLQNEFNLAGKRFPRGQREDGYYYQ